MTDFRSGNAALGGFNYHQVGAYTALGVYALWIAFLFHSLIPPECRFTGTALIKEAWIYRGNMRGYIPWRSTWLINCGYARLFFFGGYVAGTAYCVVAGLTKRAPLLVVIWIAVQFFCLLFFYLFGGWTFSSFGGALSQVLVAGPLTAILMGLAGLLTPLGAHLPGVSAGAADTANERWKRGARVKVARYRQIGRVLNEAARKGRTVLAGQIMDRSKECEHTMVVGTTGSGKTVAITHILASAQIRRDRLFVTSPDGALMQKFYRKGDIILNPFDQRSVRWDILSEIQYPEDYAFIANAVLPSVGSSKSNDWVGYGRFIFASTLREWYEQKRGDSRAFIKMMTSGDERRVVLKELLRTTAAYDYFLPKNEGLLNGALGTISDRIDALKYANDVEGEGFSIRKWIEAENPPTLWAPYLSSQREALKHLLPCWISLAIRNTLSLPERRDRRVWFFFDEADQLGAVSGMKDGPLRLRKVGGCVVLGFQSISLMDSIYGSDEAKAIVENFKTKLLLNCGRSDGGGTARFASEMIGSAEIARRETTVSQSLGGRLSQSTSTQEREVTKRLVLDSEILALPEREGYLFAAGDPVWKKVKFDFLTLPDRALACQRRPITFKGEGDAPSTAQAPRAGNGGGGSFGAMAEMEKPSQVVVAISSPQTPEKAKTQTPGNSPRKSPPEKGASAFKAHALGSDAGVEQDKPKHHKAKGRPRQNPSIGILREFE